MSTLVRDQKTYPTKISPKLSPEDAAAELLRRRKARSSLLPFCQYTSRNYQTPPHIVALAEDLEAIERGDLKRLIVVMPPRHGKSEIISKRFPCWYLGRHPTDRIVQVGYAESIALVHSRQARDIFISQEVRRLFPDVTYRPERPGQEMIKPPRQAAHEWGTVDGGSYYAVGIGGGLTGRGYDVGIIDDPVKDSEEAESATYRQRVWDWYVRVFFTRAEPGAAIIVVMTRWHHDDLVGRLLKLSAKDPKADQWKVLHFPAIDEEGNALWPERYPVEELEKTRAGQADNPDEPGQGSRAFESLYQGNPALVAGQIIKREWWKFYRERPKFLRIVQSWDTAFKTENWNDYTVCTTWGETDTGWYLLDVWRVKVEFPELKRAVVALYERDLPDAVIVEDKASGQSLIQELIRETKIPVLAIKVDRDKIARANLVTPTIESGRVYLPEQAEWLHGFIEELSNFPNGSYNDQVDSTTQALSWMRGPAEPVEQIVVYDSMELVDIDLDM